MTDLTREFAQLLDHGPAADDWADPGQIRRRGTARRRANAITAMTIVLVLTVVGLMLIPSQSTPAPAQRPDPMYGGPIVCSDSGFATGLHLGRITCPQAAVPGRYVDLVHGMNSSTLYTLNLPEGWEFTSPEPDGAIGSRTDLSTTDGEMGLRLVVYPSQLHVSRGEDPFLGGRALVDSIRRIEGVEVSPVRSATIGGESYRYVDIAIRGGIKATDSDCLQGVGCVPLLLHVTGRPVASNSDVAVGAIPSSMGRVYFRPHDGAVFPMIWAWNTHPVSEFSEVLAETERLLSSVKFCLNYALLSARNGCAFTNADLP